MRTAFRWLTLVIVSAFLAACAAKSEQIISPSQHSEAVPQPSLERASEQRQYALPESQLRWANQLVTQIRAHWVRPPKGSAPEAFNCALKLRLAPDGTVLDQAIVKSCGSEVLDLSLQAAIEHASPLPVPENPQDFVANLVVNFCPSAAMCR